MKFKSMILVCLILSVLTFSTVSATDLDGNSLNSTLNQSVHIPQSESSITNLNNNENFGFYSEDKDCVESMNESFNLDDSKESKSLNNDLKSLNKVSNSLKSSLNSIDSDENSLKSSLSTINSSNMSKNEIFDELDSSIYVGDIGLLSSDVGDGELDSSIYVGDIGLLSSDINSKIDNSISESIEIESEDFTKSSLKSTNVLTASTSTFSDLQTLINNAKEGSTINLGSTTFIGNGSRVLINKSITINGGSLSNHAIIDGKNLSRIITITANNVHLMNIDFINGMNRSVLVSANNTSIANCNFKYNEIHLSVTSNKTQNFLVENCTFSYAYESAGSSVGIFAKNATVRNCNFTNNTVYNDENVQGIGGGLQIGASANEINVGFVMNCNFINNTVITKNELSHAGALCFRPGIKVTNTNFINNYCNNQGGATTLHSDGELVNCTFINNTAGVFGGAISTGFNTDDISVNITNCSFIGNTAPMGGAIQVKGNNVRVTNSIFKDNKANESDGGALFIAGNEAIIINSSFENNYAKNVGAGLLINGSDVSLLNLSFNKNIADYGAAVYVIGSNANLFNSNFTNHNVKYGSVYINGLKTYVYDCIFLNNTGVNGAGLYIEGSNATLLYSDFSKNNVSSKGGALYIDGSYAKIIASNFLYNDAIPNSSNLDSGLGGAVYIRGNYNTIDSSDFKYNTARNGSAIYTDGRNMTLSNTNFDKNQAWSYKLESNINPSISYFNRSDILINLTLVGGNNIANAIYNTASINDISFYNVSYISSKGSKVTGSNEIHPVNGAENSKNGSLLYQDDREDNQLVNLVVYKNQNSKSVSTNDILLNQNFTTGILGNVSFNLSSYIKQGLTTGNNLVGSGNNQVLSVGNYSLYAVHIEDDYYKEIDSTDDFEVLPLVDLAVDIVSPKIIVEYNKTNKFTIKVLNNGPNNASSVKVNAKVPNDLIIVSVSPSVGTYNNQTGVWTIGNLNSGENQSLVINTRVNSTNSINFFVNVSSQENDTNITNNYDNQTIIIPVSDLAIDVKASKNNGIYGDKINWTITITNNGPDNASKIIVLVSDLKSSDLIYLNSSTTDFNISSQKFELSKLEKGENYSFVISTQINSSNKNITLNANVSSDTFENNLANNKDLDTVNVAALTDVAITVNLSNKTANSGDNVEWTLIVNNNGPDKANNVIVSISDLNSLNLTIVNSSDVNYNSNSNQWIIGDLDKNTSKKLVLTTKVRSSNNKITLNAVVNTSTLEFNKTNNLDNDTLSVNPLCDVEIDISVSEDSANKEDIVNWTIEVSNEGPDLAKDIVVSIPDLDSLGLIIVNTSANITDNEWRVGNLESGNSNVLVITTKVNTSNEDVPVEVSVETTTYELDKENNYDEDVLSIEALCDLEIHVNAKDNNNSNLTNANNNDIIYWEITVKNLGPDTASDVIVNLTDLASLGLTIINSSSGSYDSNSNEWSIGELDNDESLVLLISTKVENSNINLTVDANVDSSTFELNKVNNYDNEILVVNPLCDLEISVNVSNSSVNKEDFVNWTISLINNGPDRAENVSLIITNLESLGLIIVDSYYDGAVLTLVNASGDEYKLSFSILRTEESTEEDSNKDGVDSDDSNSNESDDSNSNEYDDSGSENNNSESSDSDDSGSEDNNLDDSNSNQNEYINLSINEENGTLKWFINGLDNNEQAVLILTTKVNTSNNNLTAEGIVKTDTYELNKVNNYDNDTLNVNPLSDLKININVSENPIKNGDTVNIILNVTNDGPDNASDVIVSISDLEESGLNIINKSDDSFNNDSNNWIIGDLAQGESIVLNLTVEANKSNDNVSISAEVNTSTYELDKYNNIDNTNLEILPICDIEITIVPENKTVLNGEVINWIITLKNNGPDNAIGITVYNKLPDGIEFITYDLTKGSLENITNGSNIEFNWNVANLTNGESTVLVLATKALKEGTVLNDVKVNSSTLDSNESNNYDNASVEVIYNPLLNNDTDINGSNNTGDLDINNSSQNGSSEDFNSTNSTDGSDSNSSDSNNSDSDGNDSNGSDNGGNGTNDDENSGSDSSNNDGNETNNSDDSNTDGSNSNDDSSANNGFNTDNENNQGSDVDNNDNNSDNNNFDDGFDSTSDNSDSDNSDSYGSDSTDDGYNYDDLYNYLFNDSSDDKDSNDSNKTNKLNKSKVKSYSNKSKLHSILMKNTGNPLSILILVIFALFSVNYKKEE